MSTLTLVRFHPARPNFEDDGSARRFAVKLLFHVVCCQIQLSYIHLTLVKNKSFSFSIQSNFDLTLTGHVTPYITSVIVYAKNKSLRLSLAVSISSLLLPHFGFCILGVTASERV